MPQVSLVLINLNPAFSSSNFNNFNFNSLSDLILHTVPICTFINLSSILILSVSVTLVLRVPARPPVSLWFLFRSF